MLQPGGIIDKPFGDTLAENLGTSPVVRDDTRANHEGVRAARHFNEREDEALVGSRTTRLSRLHRDPVHGHPGPKAVRPVRRLQFAVPDRKAVLATPHFCARIHPRTRHWCAQPLCRRGGRRRNHQQRYTKKTRYFARSAHGNLRDFNLVTASGRSPSRISVLF
ncbi:MAG: hypothetical protein E2P03_06385 [Acidobacteria bacterium]|nr:MAG: hypothetical protein E2P03_06385 [Acidobacteriota bacterium]